MSSSCPPPEVAASSGTLSQHESEHANVVVVEESDKKNKSPRPPPRSKSASLLTQALATNYEAEEEDDDGAETPTHPTSFNPLNKPEQDTVRPTSDLEPPYLTRNGLTTVENTESKEHEMAVVFAPPTGDARTQGQHDFSSTSFSYELPSGTGSSLFSLPRDSVMTSKGRGTSLERTDKEKKVESPLHGPVTTNPGDTGLSGVSTPQSPITPDISANPPTDGMRARYRSWRDARPPASERTWSIGQQSGDDSGQVENSIKDAIAGIGPNNRSRKASHSMRFFKEGLPEDKSKRKDSRTRSQTKDGSLQSKSVITAESTKLKDDESRDLTRKTSPFPSPHNFEVTGTGDSSPKREHSTTQSELGYFDIGTAPALLTEEQLRSFPAQLLADIRKNHNLTPGAHKGTSFSQSLPVTESEKSLPDMPLSESPEQKEPPDATNQDDDSEAHQSKTDEDDDSGHEEIFSAVFLPHKKTHDDENEEDEDEDEEVVQEMSTMARPSLQRLEKSDKSKSQQWLEEHEVPSSELDEKFLGNQSKSIALPSPRFPKSPSPFTEKDPPYFPQVQESSRGDNATNEQAPTVRDDNGANEDPESDTTPTGSLKRHSTFAVPKPQEPPPEPKQPLDAIELIPYRHQVGGHTTMWRFSKRAVCKELNNRENEFYENVERLHPKLCKFLPRYIGVLNVSFLEKKSRKTAKKEGHEDKETGEPQPESLSTPSKPAVNPSSTASEAQPVPTRVISQSLQSSSVPIPTVTFAANRHIIPKSLLRPFGPFGDPHYRSKSDSEAPIPKALQHDSLSTYKAESQAHDHEDATYSASDIPDVKMRPTLEDKHSDSWGSTIKNKDLRNKVFDEVFLRHPIHVQHQKKGMSHRRSLPHRNPAALRPSISESNLSTTQKASDATISQPVEESMRRRALKTAAEIRNLSLTTITSPDSLQSAKFRGSESTETQVEEDDKTGTSAPEYDSKPCEETQTGKHKRRYSSGGLRRKPTEVAAARGNLKYFEEADDAGYKGDGEEDEVFAMDLDASDQKQAGSVDPQGSFTEGPTDTANGVLHQPQNGAEGTMLPAAPVGVEEPVAAVHVPRPVNPKEAQAQQDARVVYFLLLEDLTAGMKKPCIMDLKMGTRQYGVDANEKKQKSQRQKCSATTSKELGVRVCGLQVWDVKTQTYIFQDKYFGRDLKAGQEFRGALERFLFDGVDYSSVLRRIPTILKKLAELELLITTLKGYRFYAASLLMFYDGDNSEEGESDSAATEKEVGKKKKEIDFKIADFANCVIREDDLTDRSCPPRHPEEPDRGFLRGLRSLRIYFRAIEKELQRRELGLSREQGIGLDGNADEVNGYDDEGEVSY